MIFGKNQHGKLEILVKKKGKRNTKNSINILKIREIVFGFRTSGGNFNYLQLPKGLGDLGHMLLKRGPK